MTFLIALLNVRETVFTGCHDNLTGFLDSEVEGENIHAQ